MSRPERRLRSVDGLEAAPGRERMRHPFADQFGNEVAWRFSDVLVDLAARSRHEIDLVRRIEAVRQVLARARKQDLADAWGAFVARWARSLASELDVETVSGHVRSILDVEHEVPPPPERPYVREVLPRAFGQRPPAVPDGWVAESIGHWAGRPAEVVYDPRRHQLSVTSDRSEVGSVLVAAGWRWHASDGRRSLWVQDRLAGPRAALDRLDRATPTPERPGPGIGGGDGGGPAAPGVEVSL
jgi:hypothetical protein